ncbi:hypothetical protein DYH09_21930 [bacterium CPR1]|nr:hypothetical protein [bacterium CPR1]
MGRGRYLAISALFLFSGAAGLILQLIWARRLALVFGSTVHSTSTTASAFLLGLGVGAYLAGRYLTRRPNLLGIFGLLELGVGASGLAVTWLIPQIVPLAVQLTRTHPDEAVFGGLRFAIVFVMLIVPCTLMGATLPVLTHFLVSQEGLFGPILARLYTVNTLGGAIGVMLADFALVGRLGVFQTAVVAALFDMAVGLLALLASSRFPGPAEQPDESPSGRVPLSLSLLLFVIGFCGLALEILWTRLLVFVNGTDIHAFSLVLAVFLVGLVGGGFLAGRYLRARSEERVLAALLVALGWLSLASLLTVAFMRNLSLALIGMLGIDGSRVVVNALLVLPCALVLGALFPLINSALYRQLQSAGPAVGQAYVWNTAGNMLGSLMAGFVLIPLLGLQRSLLLVALLAGIAGLCWQRRPALWAAVIALAFTSLLLPGDYLLRQLYARDYPNILYHAEDHLSSVALVKQWSELELDSNPNLIVDGFTMMHNDLRSKRYATMLGLVPCTLHPEPREVLVICLGLANTLSAVTRNPRTERVDCVELSPKVNEAIRLLPYARETLESDKVKVHLGDGRNYLLTTDRLYDVITAEPPPPRNAGIVSLYSREYYQLCRSRLKPGGLVAHWLPIGLMTRFQARATLRAFQDVFPYTYLFQGEDLHIVMLGSDRALDLLSVDLPGEAWLEELGLAPGALFAAAYLRGPEEVRRYVANTPPLTDDHPYLQYDLGLEEPDWEFFFSGSLPSELWTPETRKAQVALRTLPLVVWTRSGNPLLDRLVQLEAARAVLKGFPDNAYFRMTTRTSEQHQAHYQGLPGADGAYNRARVAFSTGDFPTALREIDSLKVPDNPELALFLQLFRALVLTEAGRLEEAAALYQAASSPDPRLDGYIKSKRGSSKAP